MERAWSVIAGLVVVTAGVLTYKNWAKIKSGFLEPLSDSLSKQYTNLSFAGVGALARQKEKVEDLLSLRKSPKAKRGRKSAKK